MSTPASTSGRRNDSSSAGVLRQAGAEILLLPLREAQQDGEVGSGRLAHGAHDVGGEVGAVDERAAGKRSSRALVPSQKNWSIR